MSASRPNVLVFIPHDLGDTLHCYGHASVRSPHLDALAERGVRFANCFTTSSECTPSRGSMWSGLHPHQNGLMGLSNFGWELRKPHLAARLRDAGYQTYLFGVQHETHGDARELGYLEHRCQGERFVGPICQGATAFLRSGASHDNPGPWFACVGFHDVHRPWRTPSTFAPDALDVPPYLPDNPTVRNDLALFHQNIFDMDRAVGGVLETLEASGLAESTLVLFTTDHGAGFPRAKATLYDPGIRVPLIMHWPGRVEGGAVYDPLVSNLDVTPTILDLCGLSAPEHLAGRSFRPLLDGEDRLPRDQVDGGLFYDVAYDPMHYVRTATHKYIRSFAVTDEDAAGTDPEVLSTFAAGQWIRLDDFDVLSSAAWQSMDVDTSRPPREELYDLAADPHEQRNLADDPAAAAVLQDMRRRLETMMRRTKSPLLNGGHVPPPEAQRWATDKFRPGGPMYQQND